MRSAENVFGIYRAPVVFAGVKANPAAANDDDDLLNDRVLEEMGFADEPPAD